MISVAKGDLCCQGRERLERYELGELDFLGFDRELLSAGYALPYREVGRIGGSGVRTWRMSLANRRKSNLPSLSLLARVCRDMSTSKDTSCLSSLSHGLRPTTRLQASCWIEKRSGTRREPSLVRDERMRMPSAYGSALGLTTSTSMRRTSENASKQVSNM